LNIENLGSTFTKLTNEENNTLQEMCGYRVEKFASHSFEIGRGWLPWTAAVFRLNETQQIEDALPSCGATIISKRHLVSAAHCFSDNDCKEIQKMLKYQKFKFLLVSKYLANFEIWYKSEILMTQIFV
jgi:hypothetical protein